MPLHETAMLANLSIRGWMGRRTDKAVTAETIEEHEASSDAGRWRTRLVSAAALSGISTVISRARTYHYQNTLPWSDNGPRILPTAMFAEYSRAMRELRADFEHAVTEFLAAYDEHKRAAKARLGKLYKETMFPDPATLAGAYSLRVDLCPIPDGKDFRVQLSADDLNEARKSVETQLREAMGRGIRECWDRLHQVVNRLASKLANTEAVFRDSLVRNIRELCDLLDRMNLSQDKQLAASVAEVREQLGTQDPEVLRNDKGKRAAVVGKAKGLLAKIERAKGGKK